MSLPATFPLGKSDLASEGWYLLWMEWRRRCLIRFSFMCVLGELDPPLIILKANCGSALWLILKGPTNETEKRFLIKQSGWMNTESAIRHDRRYFHIKLERIHFDQTGNNRHVRKQSVFSGKTSFRCYNHLVLLNLAGRLCGRPEIDRQGI